MAERTINTRIVNKHDTAENWAKAVNFIPIKGEIIVYDADVFVTVPKIKIGNGETNVNDLPFLNEKEILEQTRYLISGSKNGYDFNLPNIGVKSLQIILLHDLNATGTIEIINQDGIVISSYVPSTYFIIGGDSFTIDSSMNETNSEFWSYVSTGDFNSIYVVDEDNKKVMCSFVYEYYISSIDAISNLENSKASIEYVNNKINENIEYINDKNNEILLESKKYTDKQTQLGFTYSEEFSIVSNPISQILSEGFNGSITSIEMNTDEWDELKVTFFDSEGIDIATIMGQGTHEVSIDNVYMFRFENSGFPGNIKLILDSKTNLNTVLDNSKAYTDEKATLGISVSKIYYTDEDNEIYVFGDQYLEIPEEFEGNISEIIVSKESGDTAPYIQVSFYDVEYNLIETIEILPESPDQDGNGEFINVSREVNITGAAYVMGSDGGCSCIGILTLINNTETVLGEEVNKKDIKVLESAKTYTDNLIEETKAKSDEMLEISKAYTNELKVDIKSADTDKSVYTYTFDGEKINFDLVSNFYFWSDKDINETFFSLVFDENKFILDHKYNYGYARFCNPNNLNDFIYGVIHLIDESQEIDPNVWEVVYNGCVEMTKEEFISRYPYFLISKSSEIDKYEWKPIDDILPDNGVIYKRAITKSWENQNDYVPTENEMIIYDKDEIETLSFGDGSEINDYIELVEAIIECPIDSSDTDIRREFTIKTESELNIIFLLPSNADMEKHITAYKIDFINEKVYLTESTDIENAIWELIVYNMNGELIEFPWDEYKLHKNDLITAIENLGCGVMLKYYIRPYSLKTRIKIGDGKTNVNDLPFLEQSFNDICLEDGTSLSSVLKINNNIFNYGHNNVTETGFEDSLSDDITTCTMGYDNINKSIYSLVTGKSNINTGNDSFVTACFNENQGKNSFVAGYLNKNILADEENLNSSNNVVIGGAYNENIGISNTIFGHHNKANGYGQTVIGCYNIEDSGATFIIGGGTSAIRANLLKVSNDGSLFISSDIKDMKGEILYPFPTVPKDSLLSAIPVDVIQPTIAATGTVGSITTPINRIVVVGNYEDYVNKGYLRFTDSQEDIEYFETILNVAERTDGKINIEFSSDKVNFVSDGNANAWKSRIGTSLYIFNVKVLWTDKIKVPYVESNEIVTQAITTETITTELVNTNEITVGGVKPIFINRTDNIEDEIYVHDYNLIGIGTIVDNVFACGTIAGKYNRIVVSPEMVNSLTENIVGKVVRFYNGEDYIEEIIIDSSLRTDGRYNIDYTTTTMPFNITIGELKEFYSKIIVGSEEYKWKNLDSIVGLGSIYSQTFMVGENPLPTELQSVITEITMIKGDEEKDNPYITFYDMGGTEIITIEGAGTHNVLIEGAVSFNAHDGWSADSNFILTSDTRTSLGIEVEKNIKSYTDNAIQQAIIDSWEVEV